MILFKRAMMAMVVASLMLLLCLSQALSQEATAKGKKAKAATGQADSGQAASKPGAGKASAKEITRGALEDNLTLLNQWGGQPEHVQRMYEAAYKVLAAKPNATFADVAADAEIQRLCAAKGIVHLGGPMLGAVTSDGARVWLRTVRPASVEVRVTIDGSEKTFGPVKSTLETDLAAVVPVTGLEPLTHYPYSVLVDGKPIFAKNIPKHASIYTAPDPARPGTVRIAFGSCQHRWGLGNGAQADLIRSREPAGLLLMGDIAVQDRKAHMGLARADYLLRDFMPAWQDLVAAVPVFATWDDHDYYANDASGTKGGITPETQADIWDVFRHAWNNPAYGFGQPRRGVFLRTRLGPCDVIMTDNRYFRGNKEAFLGEEQLKWLQEQLLQCQGPFIILSCGTMWSDYVSEGKDSWGVFDPEGRERIFSLIEQKMIAGVLLISGDRHGARGFRIPRPSGFNFYEFGAASLGGRRGPPETDPSWTTQFYHLAGQYAFGEFTIDATAADPTVVFRLIREDGNVVHELKLTRSQLTPPGK